MEIKYFYLNNREREEILNKIKKKLKKFDDIVFAYIHGGFVEEEYFRDIDVAIWLEDLEKAFFYTVHLPSIVETETKIPIDVQVLNSAPLPFKYHVFTRGLLLFSRNEDVRSITVDLTIRQYIDFKTLEKSLQ